MEDEEVSVIDGRGVIAAAGAATAATAATAAPVPLSNSCAAQADSAGCECAEQSYK
jgi:hypothetical protein